MAAVPSSSVLPGEKAYTPGSLVNLLECHCLPQYPIDLTVVTSSMTYFQESLLRKAGEDWLCVRVTVDPW